MVLFNWKDRVAFENIDLGSLSYSDLQALKMQLKSNMRAVEEYISDMEECPDKDDEVVAWSEAEYLRKQDEADRNCNTEW